MIHVWLGTSQDEMGTAAYKTVELDSGILGDAAVQVACSLAAHQTLISYSLAGILGDAAVQHSLIIA